MAICEREDDMPDLPAEERNRRIEKLLVSIREDQVSDSDLLELREFLKEDPEAFEFYLEQNQVDNLLEDFFAGETSELFEEAARVGGYRKHRLLPKIAAVAAILIALAIGLFLWGQKSEEGSLSGLKEEREGDETIPLVALHSTHQAALDEEIALHDQVAEGVVELDDGIAQLIFKNGSKVVVEGRAGFEVIDEMTLALEGGKIWVFCPKEAHGFTVLTPGGRKIVDLGTKFGVEVHDDGATEVHVFKGGVEIAGLLPESFVLSEGEACSWGESGHEFEEVPLRMDDFVSDDELARRRFEAYQDLIAAREDLIVNYDFSRRKDRLVKNNARLRVGQSYAEVKGATRVGGRFLTSHALQFENRFDRLCLEVDPIDHLEGLSVGFWLKVDRLQTTYSTLLNARDCRPGALHFQLTHRGVIKASIGKTISVQTKPNAVELGKWQFVVISWDFQSLSASFYCDGELVEIDHSMTHGVPIFDRSQLHLGPCHVGLWSESHSVDAVQVYSPPKLQRSFKGRMDEVLLFNRALPAEEVAQIYKLGLP